MNPPAPACSQQASCLVNPRAGYETTLNLLPVPAERAKRVAVVGSGPAGMAAATGCAERGHKVTLFEGSRELGGQVRKNSIRRLEQRPPEPPTFAFTPHDPTIQAA